MLLPHERERYYRSDTTWYYNNASLRYLPIQLRIGHPFEHIRAQKRPLSKEITKLFKEVNGRIIPPTGIDPFRIDFLIQQPSKKGVPYA
jgi:hypothetical protein